MSESEFYCPLYDGQITQYDCDEISCGAKSDYLPNDGLPHLLSLNTIRSKRYLCLSCEHCIDEDKTEIQKQIDKFNGSAAPSKRMSENEIRQRLSGRAAEYLMFMDDDDETPTQTDLTNDNNIIISPDFQKLKDNVELF